MKLAKLTNVTTVEAASIIVLLHGKKLLYRDAPLMDPSQIVEVLNEYQKEACDSIMFDVNAIFDSTAYGLARDCVDRIRESYDIKVVIFNAPEYATVNKESTT